MQRWLALAALLFFVGASGMHARILPPCALSYDPPDQAIARCSAEIRSGKLHGDDLARAYVDRALTYMNEQDFSHAIDDLNAAIKLNPQNESYLDHRAIAYLGQHDYAHAILSYNKLIEIERDPDDQVRNLLRRGWAYRAIGAYDNAVSDFSTAFSLIIPRGRAYIALIDKGLASFEAGHYDLADSDIADASRPLQRIRERSS